MTKLRAPAAMDDPAHPGQGMYDLAARLFPICRSLTGNGVRQTLAIIRERLPDLKLHEVPSGTRCFDWTVPDEWNIRDAYIVRPDGRKIANFADNNLHVVGYSEPVDRTIALDELQNHLHSLPGMPDAIPYVTSYYNRTWGFCLSELRALSLARRPLPRRHRQYVGARAALPMPDLVLPGRSKKEIASSRLTCAIPQWPTTSCRGRWLQRRLAAWACQQRPDRRYTYRFVFIPETIGSVPLSQPPPRTPQGAVIAGFNVTCVGDERDIFLYPRQWRHLCRSCFATRAGAARARLHAV